MIREENDKIVSAIQELTEFVNDGQMGYRRAANETKNTRLKGVFNRFYSERAAFANELNSIIRKFGGTVEDSGTVKGALFRQWMSVKATFTGHDDDSLISSCKYGEEWALKAYSEALEKSYLPQDVRQTLINQRMACQKCYNELETLEAAHV